MKRNYIPTIDISSLTKSNFKSKKSIQTIKQIEKACKKVGFFQITGHGIKINKVSEVGQKFFKLPLKNKIKLAPKKWNKLSKNIYFLLGSNFSSNSTVQNTPDMIINIPDQYFVR